MTKAGLIVVAMMGLMACGPSDAEIAKTAADEVARRDAAIDKAERAEAPLRAARIKAALVEAERVEAERVEAERAEAPLRAARINAALVEMERKDELRRQKAIQDENSRLRQIRDQSGDALREWQNARRVYEEDRRRGLVE